MADEAKQMPESDDEIDFPHPSADILTQGGQQLNERKDLQC